MMPKANRASSAVQGHQRGGLQRPRTRGGLQVEMGRRWADGSEQNIMYVDSLIPFDSLISTHEVLQYVWEIMFNIAHDWLFNPFAWTLLHGSAA